MKKNKKIFNHYKYEIKQTLSNIENFNILLKEEIITVSYDIYNEIINKYKLNRNRYLHFFYPTIEKLIGEEEGKEV